MTKWVVRILAALGVCFLLSSAPKTVVTEAKAAYPSYASYEKQTVDALKDIANELRGIRRALERK